LRAAFEKQRKQPGDAMRREESLKAEVNALLARQNQPPRYPE